MKAQILSLLCCLFAWLLPVQAQDSPNIRDFSWKKVADRMLDEWYGGQQARAIADQLLARQMESGGWQKNIPYHHLLSAEELAKVNRTGVGSTIDNGATTTEMRFLARVYAHSGEDRYREGFLRGLRYLFEAQYDNGGWPQFYPERTAVNYASHITYNDDAMVNVLRQLRDIADGRSPYDALKLDDATRAQARASFDKGIGCILKTQIRVDGKPTVWCAQHDEHTFAPAPARAYELASFSGAESASIVALLMSIPDPSPEIVAAVKGAVAWFETHAVKDIRVEHVPDGSPKGDARVVSAPGNVLWARFYDLETGKPFFCGRDGVKHATLAEIEKERRGGYSWYTNAPQRVLDRYAKWISGI